jgi:3-oxoadipate enol-lactonase
MSFAQVGPLRVHYDQTESSNLPVLVLSNSLGVTLEMWSPQIAEFAVRHRVLRYDTRGHGRSSGVPGELAIADLGRDVLNLLDALNIERASFCGLSMGGIIGQWLAVHAADRLDKLVLANTAAKIGNADAWNTRIATVLKEGLGPIIPGTLERWFTNEFREANPEVVASTRSLLEETDATSYAACCGAIRDADFREAVASITVPTLVIAGRHDPVTPPNEGRFLASSIARARYVELETAHLSNLGDAASFNAAVLSFLSA